MEKMWKCRVCGYIHKGDDPPGKCPICGVTSDDFDEIELKTQESNEKSFKWYCTICEYIHSDKNPPEKCPVCNADKSVFKPHHEKSIESAACEACKIVIVGAGISGLTAAEEITYLNKTAEVTLVSNEPELPYYRLNLTRLLAEEVGRNDLKIKEDSWYKERNIKFTNDEVTHVDRSAKKVTTKDGKVYNYDKLILSTGSHAFLPPISGVDLPKVTVLRSIEDVEKINTHIQSSKSCICIGGGLLGLEAAGALHKRGLKVTVVEGADWLLPRQLPKTIGDHFLKHLSKIDIATYLSARAKEITETSKGLQLTLEGSEKIEADFIIVSAGVRSNTHLARSCGLKVNYGICVDDTMKTSDDSIFACGDSAECEGRLYGIWPASYLQGRVAGHSAVGLKEKFTAIPPSNQLKVLDVDLFSVGVINPTDGSYEKHYNSSDNEHYHFTVRDGKLVGATLYGDISLASYIEEAIMNKTSIQLLEKVLTISDSLSKKYGS